MVAPGASTSGNVLALSESAPAADSPAKRTLLRRERLARRLALALRDSVVRAELRSAFAKSSHREGKVELQQLLSEGSLLEQRVFANAAALTSGRADLAGESYEIYMPVRAHRETWNGGAEVLVVAQGEETDAAKAYSPDGSIRTLSLRSVPTIPVVVVNAAEVDFSKQAPANIASLLTCDDPFAVECGGGSGGGTPPSPPRPGLYIRAIQLEETNEPWTNGDPELEIIPYFPVGVLNPDLIAEKAGCSGQGGPSDRYFDANSTSWNGRAMLIPEDTLEAFRLQFPDRSFRIHVHEDDSESCTYKASDNTEKQIITSLDLLLGGITAGVKGIGNPGLFAFKAALSVGKAIQVVNENSDDIHGYLVARELVPFTPPSPTYNWAIMRTLNRTTGPVQVLAGWAQPEYVAP